MTDDPPAAIDSVASRDRCGVGGRCVEPSGRKTMDDPVAIDAPTPAKAPSRPTRAALAWAAVRYFLGLAQMTGAIVGLLSLMLSGPTYWTILIAAMTTMLTVLSRLLFH